METKSVMSATREQRRRSSAGQRLNPALERRWAAYALAASAGLAATAQPALAKIVYTPPRHYIITPVEGLPIRFEGSVTFQFSVACFYSPLFGLATLDVFKGRFDGQASVIALNNSPKYSAAALSSGAEIGPGGNFMNVGNDSPARMAYKHYHITGQWAHAQHRFLGLRFTLGGNTYYGWAEFSVFVGGPYQPNEIVALPEGYAFQTVPNQPIAAGAGRPHTASAMQPATLGLLAVGAPGLTYWRRKESPVQLESAN